MSDPRKTQERYVTAPTSDMLRFVGWYDGADQATPTHEPEFPGPCIACLKPMSVDDVRTISLMWQDKSHGRSLFYRMHRTCAEAMGEAERNAYDGAVLDAMPTLTNAQPAGGSL